MPGPGLSEANPMPNGAAAAVPAPATAPPAHGEAGDPRLERLDVQSPVLDAHVELQVLIDCVPNHHKAPKEIRYIFKNFSLPL